MTLAQTLILKAAAWTAEKDSLRDGRTFPPAGEYTRLDGLPSPPLLETIHTRRRYGQPVGATACVGVQIDVPMRRVGIHSAGCTPSHRVGLAVRFCNWRQRSWSCSLRRDVTFAIEVPDALEQMHAPRSSAVLRNVIRSSALHRNSKSCSNHRRAHDSASTGTNDQSGRVLQTFEEIFNDDSE